MEKIRRAQWKMKKKTRKKSGFEMVCKMVFRYYFGLGLCHCCLFIYFLIAQCFSQFTSVVTVCYSSKTSSLHLWQCEFDEKTLLVFTKFSKIV